MVNDNIQLVTMWLSADETTVLDNALITMEHLYKSGKVSIFLRYLSTEPSYYEIAYSIGRIQNTIRNDEDGEQDNNPIESEKIVFTLSMPEIDDHKRQLTFCNVDVQQNLFLKKPLVNGQLKLLERVNEIFAMNHKLELAGHPDYQLKEESYEIHLQQSKYSMSITPYID